MNKKIILVNGSVVCNFCGKPQHEVQHIVMGPVVRGGNIAICNTCVDLCVSVIPKPTPEPQSTPEALPCKLSPAQQQAILDVVLTAIARGRIRVG